MAKKLTQQQRKEVKTLSNKLGLGNGYGDLIRQAVIGAWSQDEFVTALVHSDTFRQQYPGVMQGGELAPYLTGETNASLSISNLTTAISHYKTLQNSYEQAAQQYKSIAGHIGKDKLATLIRSQTSPDEFRAKLQAIHTVDQNPEAFRIWHQEAAAAGHPDFNPFQAAMGAADQRFYDVYEATRLRQLGQGLGFDAKSALRVARAAPDVNARGQAQGPADIGSLVTQLRSQVGDIGPELQAAGISNTALASFIANPSEDPQGIAAKLQQIIAQRRASGQFVAGSQAQRGTGGGPTLFAGQQAASY